MMNMMHDASHICIMFILFILIIKLIIPIPSYLHTSMTLGCSKKTRSSKTGSSTSQQIHHIFTKTFLTGQNLSHNEDLNQSAIHERQARDQVQYCEHVTALSLAEIEELQTIHAGHDEEDSWEDDNFLMIDDILAGNASLDISHGGGEFMDLAELTEITDDLFGPAIQ